MAVKTALCIICDVQPRNTSDWKNMQNLADTEDTRGFGVDHVQESC